MVLASNEIREDLLVAYNRLLVNEMIVVYRRRKIVI